MTEDTRKALEIIKPIADELGIKVNADEKILYVDDIGIGIAWNSTRATLFEFIGYLIEKYGDVFREIGITEDQKKDIERYWVSAELLKKLKGKKDNA